MYAAIERYVRAVVESAYSEPGSLRADHEVQQWRRELTRAREHGGVGLLGVAGDDRQGAVWCSQYGHLMRLLHLWIVCGICETLSGEE